MNPADATGYCAVILPALDHYQAYFIVEDDVTRENAGKMKLLSAMMAMSANPFGAIQAALVEAALTNASSAVAAAALALKEASGESFFYILASKEPQGTRTEMMKLNSTTIDGARDEINNLPEVRALKKRLMAKLSMTDGLGRKVAFQ